MWQLLLMVPFFVFAAVFYMRNMKAMGDWAGKMGHYQVGALGPRLGLQLVNGDPTFNVATTPVASVAKKVKGSKHDAEYHLQMVGQPYGHHTDFSIDYVVDTSFSGTTMGYYGAIHVQCVGMPRFEIYRRVSTMGGFGFTADGNNTVQRVHDDARLPTLQFGDPILDQRYVIESEDPNLARQIAQAMHVYDTLDFVHVYSQNGGITFRASTTMQNMTWMNFEQVLHGLACIACALERKPLPAAITTPTRPGMPVTPSMTSAPHGNHGQPGPGAAHYPMQGAPSCYPQHLASAFQPPPMPQHVVIYPPRPS